jgi:hypothetical protein
LKAWIVEHGNVETIAKIKIDHNRKPKFVE